MSEQVVFQLDITRRRGEGPTTYVANLDTAEMTGLEAVEVVLLAVAALGKHADEQHDSIGEALQADRRKGGLSD